MQSKDNQEGNKLKCDINVDMRDQEKGQRSKKNKGSGKRVVPKQLLFPFMEGVQLMREINDE